MSIFATQTTHSLGKSETLLTTQFIKMDNNLIIIDLIKILIITSIHRTKFFRWSHFCSYLFNTISSILIFTFFIMTMYLLIFDVVLQIIHPRFVIFVTTPFIFNITSFSLLLLLENNSYMEIQV